MGWAHILQGLAPMARVVAWNAPGYFLSDAFLADAPRPEAYADVALALLDALAMDGPVHVVGSSFGSMIAACLAARQPHRIATLTLLGTSRGQRWKTPEQRAAMLAMRAASMAGGGVALALGRAHALIAPGSPALPEVRRMVAATHASGLMQAARCTDAVDVVTDYAPYIRAPTVCVTGALDGVNPPEVGRAVARAISGARYEEPPSIGHLPEMESPHFILKLLQSRMKINA